MSLLGPRPGVVVGMLVLMHDAACPSFLLDMDICLLKERCFPGCWAVLE